MNNNPKTYINVNQDHEDNHLRNTEALLHNAKKIFDHQRAMTVESASYNKTCTLRTESESLVKEARDLAEQYINDPLEENEENEEYTEADKIVEAKYNEVIQKQSSLIKEGEKVLSDSDGIKDSHATRYFAWEYETQKKKREVLLSDRERLERDDWEIKLEEDAWEVNVLKNKEEKKSEGKTNPMAISSLIDDFADTSQEMPEHTAGDD
jgi:hypothetical protein